MAPIECSVSDLNAEHVGQTLAITAQILAVDGPMSLPVRIRSVCQRCGETAEIDVDPDELVLLDKGERKAKLQFDGFAAVHSEGVCKHSYNVFKTDELVQADYYTLLVSDAASQARFSKLGHDPRLCVHLVGHNPPIANEVRLQAKVASNPSSRALELVCHEYEELETSPTAPVLTDELMARFCHIGSLSMDAMRVQIAPDMIGRPLVQEGRLLTLCSVTRIPDIEGKEIRGTLIESSIGDTTTNKSECAKDTAETQGFGPAIQAENAARTGVTYSITENRSGGWSLVWGLLPRYHGTYAVIDGLERWHSSDQQSLRGVLRDQIVEVDKVVHGKRHAAVRVTITANPEKPIKAYPMKCMAIPDCRPFTKGPDIARVDLWFIFAEEDVTPEQLANRSTSSRPIVTEDFQKFVHWAWSRKFSDIEYLVEARQEIKTQAAIMMADYRSSSLPIVHSGFRDTLCRLSVSYAVLEFSTPDGIRVVVKREHVTKAIDFLRATYEAIDLKDYVLAESKGLNLAGPEAISTVIAVGEIGITILGQLALCNGPISSTQMSEQLRMSKDTIQHLYLVLKEHDLIETTRGAGVELKPKGVALVRWLRYQNALMSQKSATSQKDVAFFSDNNEDAKGDPLP